MASMCFEVLYQWILEDIGKEPKTCSSKMILFRGEEVFRVALKNTVEKQTLIFVATKLNKIGMKVSGVLIYDNQNLENFMKLVKLHDIYDTTLHVFSGDLQKRVSAKTTFNFNIQIEGSVSHFSYQLADRLLKNQLWMTVKKLELTDIDFIVKGKKISAHKCILAARSSVFKEEFAYDGNVKQIIIDDVDFSTFEQFLYFLYTGETNKSLANEQLFKLANRYQLDTLTWLCEHAAQSKHIVTLEIAYFTMCIAPEKNAPTSSIKIGPMKDTELYFDPKTSTFLVEKDFCFLREDLIRDHIVFFRYQNEKMFFAHVTGSISKLRKCCLTNPTLRMACIENCNSSYRVVEAVCSIKHQDSLVFKWMKMERSNFQRNGLFVEFSATSNDELTLSFMEKYTMSFRIKISSTVENYHYEMMDTSCATQLWNATGMSEGYLATMTDVEISVGSRKFEAHRVVLAARSPVFKLRLEKDNKLAKSSISLSKTVDPDIFEDFLKFLYTGSLNIFANNKQLLELAEKYEVETLKKLCQTASRELGVDELTTAIVLAF